MNADNCVSLEMEATYLSTGQAHAGAQLRSGHTAMATCPQHILMICPLQGAWHSWDREHLSAEKQPRTGLQAPVKL